MSVVESGMTALDQYAAERATRVRQCGACSLPEDLRHIVDENERRTSPHSRRVVSAFLAEQGHRVSIDTLYRHATHSLVTA